VYPKAVDHFPCPTEKREKNNKNTRGEVDTFVPNETMKRRSSLGKKGGSSITFGGDVRSKRPSRKN